MPNHGVDHQVVVAAHKSRKPDPLAGVKHVPKRCEKENRNRQTEEEKIAAGELSTSHRRDMIFGFGAVGQIDWSRLRRRRRVIGKTLIEPALPGFGPLHVSGQVIIPGTTAEPRGGPVVEPVFRVIGGAKRLRDSYRQTGSRPRAYSAASLIHFWSSQNRRNILETVRQAELPLALRHQIAARVYAVFARNVHHARAPLSRRAVHRRVARGARQKPEEGRRRVGFHVPKRQVIIEARSAAAALVQEISQAPLNAFPHRQRLLAVSGVHGADLPGDVPIQQIAGHFLDEQRRAESRIAGSLHHGIHQRTIGTEQVSDAQAGRQHLRKSSRSPRRSPDRRRVAPKQKVQPADRAEATRKPGRRRSVSAAPVRARAVPPLAAAPRAACSTGWCT